MAANTSPIFPLTPVIGIANISTAVSARTASGITGLTIVGSTPGTNGQRVDQLSIIATGTTTAGMIRIWFYWAGYTTNAQLLYEIPVSAITPSATVVAWSYSFSPINLTLPSPAALYASTEKAEAFVVYKFAGDY